MSVPIRKLLSRKFNNSCLKLAGLLTHVLSFTFPSDSRRTVVFEEMIAAALKRDKAYSCGNSSRIFEVLN